MLPSISETGLPHRKIGTVFKEEKFEPSLQFHNSAQAANHHEVDCEFFRATWDYSKVERNGGKAD